MNDFSDLRGKVAAITGGSGIIGKTLARGLCNAGVNVIILDYKAERGAMTAKEITAGQESGLATSFDANVIDRDSLLRARDRIREKFGSLDILINCAGGNKATATTAKEYIAGGEKDLQGTFFDLDIEGFDGVFDLNFKGTVLPTMILAEDMVSRGSGVILNISSMNGYRPLTKIPAYSAAKAAINNLTQWLAVHFAPAGVRVNAIAPGFLLTNQNRFLLTDEKTGGMTPRGKKIISATPMGRYAEPEELVGTMLYLLSGASSFVTGVVIPVDGGFSAYSGV
ncbi:MAG: SDR family oxidoreductase [Bacteroidales bacterium]|jgi:NAD(P)-dependent dehydrogenase (short-subunit alcohol dehydrogenase family)|nr:SDR family oxidoreductase [Bacteroidales bacterium]MDX9904330.1 SDR family oxidoreductase [Bacteroidales bacterium]HNX85178.1 SDR family oxidoreductase [Bacteroidales bacterium]HOC48628.1 SDR family oxidoreductase [Bacteroidales bacterium]HPS98650.1 SDR family oxidoreductase [Bacteroidales bacterium]